MAKGKQPLINAQSKQSTPCMSKVMFPFTVAIAFNEITSVEPMNYIVNSLNISNFSLCK